MSDFHFRIAIGVVAAVFVGFVLRLEFCGDIDLPPKPPKPKITERNAQDVARGLDANEVVFQQHLSQDAKRYGVEPLPDIASMSNVLRYRAERKRRVVKFGSTVAVAGLRLTVSVKDKRIANKAMIMLTIENTSDRAMAYRVLTSLPKGEGRCGRKKNPRHNAIALAPKEKISRSECVYRSGYSLAVERVETIELPPLSYFYVSNLQPQLLGLQTRNTKGHRGADGRAACEFVLPAEVKRAMDAGQTGWRDIVDYFARHPCESYRFPSNYKAFTRDLERRLPLTGR